MLHREGKVLSEEYEDNDVIVSAVVPRRLVSRFKEFEIADVSSDLPGEEDSPSSGDNAVVLRTSRTGATGRHQARGMPTKSQPLGF